MDKSLRVILAITLTLVLSVGLMAMSGCSGESVQDIAGLGSITRCEKVPSSDLLIGGPAPDIWFETAEGQTTSLSELEGKIVLINFWTTWCGHCKTEMTFFQQIYDEWPEEELVVLAINLGESSDDVASFVQNNSLSFPVLLDTDTEAGICYYIQYLPSTLFIDKDGLIQEARVGAFQSTEEIESILNQLK